MVTTTTTTTTKDDDNDEKISTTNSVNNNNNNNTKRILHLKSILENLTLVESRIQSVLKEHSNGRYGYVTREWGFTAPGGLGKKLGGKFIPWENKLSKVKKYFWPVDSYLAMELPPFGIPDPNEIKDLSPYGEELYGNLSLHEFLKQPPIPAVKLEPSDYEDYRSAARIFLLLGTLSHLYGNSSIDPKKAILPSWIEDPLMEVANRLEIEPTLSGHFLVQENWIWKSDVAPDEEQQQTGEGAATTSSQAGVGVAAESSTTTSSSKTSSSDSNNKNPRNNNNRSLLTKRTSSRRFDRAVIKTILRECEIDDRRFRIKIYPKCFIGSQLVDVLTTHQYAESREEAVRLARRLNNNYKLFQHVTNDHMLMDKHLFYRFRKKWQKRREQLLEYDAKAAVNNNNNNDDTNNNDGNNNDDIKGDDDDDIDFGVDSKEDSKDGDDDDDDEDFVKARLMGPSDVLRRASTTSAAVSTTVTNSQQALSTATNYTNTNNNNDYRTNLLGGSKHRASKNLGFTPGDNDSIDDFLVEEDSSFQEGLLADSTNNNNNKDSSGEEEETKFPGTTRYSNNSDDNNSNGIFRRKTTRSSIDHSRTLQLYDSAGFQEVMSTIAVMGMVKIKDRRYHLRKYKKCFIGSQLIDVLMDHECASTRKDALRLARQINKRFNLFRHVVNDHELKDEYLFYRFTQAFETMIEREANRSSAVHGGGGVVGGENSVISNSIRSSSSTAASAQHQDPPPLRRVSFRTGGIVAPSPTVTRFADNYSDMQSNYSGDSFSAWSTGSRDNDSYDSLFGIDEKDEFRLDNIAMLYPAFGTNHEKVNQLVPACMGNALCGLPYFVLDIITAMKNVLEAELNVMGMGMVDNEDTASIDSYESRRLYDLLYKVAFSVSRCKEQFQQMSTDPKSRFFNSKYVSIKQTQPLSNGVLVRRTKGGEPKPAKGTTGTQFPYFHLLDWLLGRFQHNDGNGSNNGGHGLVAQIASVDETFPRPQREYIRSVATLDKSSTLRGFLEALGQPKELLGAYNHLIECYSGEGGLLQAHCRKLYSYIHNNVQSSTSGTNHLASSGSDDKAGAAATTASGRPIPNVVDNHKFAVMMFKHMRQAAEDRWKLRLPPLMAEVGKMIYSTSESGGFTTVALDISDAGLLYEYGDVVKVLIPNTDKNSMSWMYSLSGNDKMYFKLEDMIALYKDTGNGWGWNELWEALGWCRQYEKGGNRKGVPLELLSRYIEQGQIRDDSGKASWVNCPLDLGGRSGGSGKKKMFAMPPPITLDMIASLEPVSPRVYSVSGVESQRVFLLISKPEDGAHHHGYEGMSDKNIETVHCSFAPATFFLVPPQDVNLVCIASGTGISPFVGLVDSIGSRQGSYTIVHQCKSSDLFLANSQSWLDFTAINPGACVMGYISGDRSRRNCPMRYVVRNGAFEETTVLRRHNACAYYFECEIFQGRLEEAYKKVGLNLAYCCGGVKSAIEPLRKFASRQGLTYEFTCETYGVPPTLTRDSRAGQIGGTIVNLDHVSPIHPGGDQIIHQLDDIADAKETSATSKYGGDQQQQQVRRNSSSPSNKTKTIPDHSIAFYELHPHAYNLHRCLRTPLDADSAAFTQFLQRQAMSKSVMASMASKYAEVALSRPDDSKIVIIATELQSSAIRQQIDAGDSEGAEKSAAYLKELLDHISPSQDDQATERWMQSLNDFSASFNHN